MCGPMHRLLAQIYWHAKIDYFQRTGHRFGNALAPNRMAAKPGCSCACASKRYWRSVPWHLLSGRTEAHPVAIPLNYGDQRTAEIGIFSDTQRQRMAGPESQGCKLNNGAFSVGQGCTVSAFDTADFCDVQITKLGQASLRKRLWPASTVSRH